MFKGTEMILKLAALTCAFYLAITLLLEVALIVLAHVRGQAGIFSTRLGWGILFGLKY